FPCSPLAAPVPLSGAAPRAEQLSMPVHLLARAPTALLKACRLPHLELGAEAHERHVGAKAGVGAQRFRKHDTSVLIDGDAVHVTIEAERQLVPLVRIIRQAVEKPVDGFRKALAARIERWSVERGVAINAPRDPRRIAVTLQHRAKRGWDGDPPLGVDLVRERGDKAIHSLA